MGKKLCKCGLPRGHSGNCGGGRGAKPAPKPRPVKTLCHCGRKKGHLGPCKKK